MGSLSRKFLLLARLLALAGAAPALAQWPKPSGINDATGLGHSTQDCSDPLGGGGRAGVLYVDTNARGNGSGRCWADAFTELSDALDFALTSDSVTEIWVARGVYTPSDGDRRSAFELRSGLRILGGFVGGETSRRQRNPDPWTNGTILSGDLFGDEADKPDKADNAWHVVRAIGVDRSAVLDGFGVIGGAADGDADGLDVHGGGLLIVAGSPTLHNCVFALNQATKQGGAIFVDDGQPLFTDCAFVANDAQQGGAIAFASSAGVEMERCDFAANWATDDGGAMLFGENSDGAVLNCRFVGNTGQRGGALAVVGSSAPEFVNLLFSGNLANLGGAVLAADSSLTTYTNCTLYGNAASGAGGGAYLSSLKLVTLRNCIMWGNADLGGVNESAQVSLTSGAWRPVFDYNCVQGWSGAFGGAGNIALQPRFIDPDGPDNILGTLDDDLRLGAGPACVDAGTNLVPSGTYNLSTPASAVDLAGQPRHVDHPATHDTGLGPAPLVDLGAYELQNAGPNDPATP